MDIYIKVLNWHQMGLFLALKCNSEKNRPNDAPPLQPSPPKNHIRTVPILLFTLIGGLLHLGIKPA